MKDLIGKIVKIVYNQPAPSGSSRDSFPVIGRVVKYYKSEDRVLIVNKECLTDADVSSHGPNPDAFKWGTWVQLDEAVLEVQE